jgi:hypothetical protein
MQSRDADARIREALADTTLPAGVRGGVESAAALELLTEFLAAWPRVAGSDDAKDKRRAVVGLPRTASTERRHVRDRIALAPALRKLLPRVKLHVASTSARQRATLGEEIARAWNRALRDAGALTLPPLCEVCGTWGSLRKSARTGRRPKSSRWQPLELATVCSDECYAARKSRRARLRRKLGRKRATR